MKIPRVDANEERQFYVSRELAFRLFPFFCNDKERLLFALGRFAGLRVPSEVMLSKSKAASRDLCFR